MGKKNNLMEYNEKVKNGEIKVKPNKTSFKKGQKTANSGKVINLVNYGSISKIDLAYGQLMAMSKEKRLEIIDLYNAGKMNYITGASEIALMRFIESMSRKEKTETRLKITEHIANRAEGKAKEFINQNVDFYDRNVEEQIKNLDTDELRALLKVDSGKIPDDPKRIESAKKRIEAERERGKKNIERGKIKSGKEIKEIRKNGKKDIRSNTA